MESQSAPPLNPRLIDESLPTPLYHQIYLLIRERIISGALQAGALIEGEQEMAKLLGVSRITVKRALNDLAAEGLVKRHRGRGTIVADGAALPVVVSSFDSLIESLQQLGLQTELELVEVAEVAADTKVAERLDLKLKTIVQRAVRLRRLNGEPFSYLVTYTPLAIASLYTEAELASTPMLTLLERAGGLAQEAELWITAVAAGAAEASALAVAAGAPLLKIDRVMRGPRHRPVQFIEVQYRPDRFHYHVRSQRRRKGASVSAPSASEI